jgi:hypothetical protein
MTQLEEPTSSRHSVDTYPQLLAIHTLLRGTPCIRVPYSVAADAYLLELDRQMVLENGFVKDLQFMKLKILRLRSMMEDLT